MRRMVASGGGLPGPRSFALGAYGADDANVNPGGMGPLGNPYNERTVFSGSPAPRDNVTPVRPIASVRGHVIPTVFATNAFSKQVVGFNPERGILIVQNFSAAFDLFVNLGVDAGLNNGLLVPARTGFIWDAFVPTDAVYAYFDSGIAQQTGIAFEGVAQ